MIEESDSNVPKGDAGNPLDVGNAVPQRFVKQYAFEISGSLEQFARDEGGATYMIQPQHSHMFAAPATLGNSKGGNANQVVFRNVTLKQVSSSFPVALGVRMTGVEGNVFSGTGESYAHVVFPHTNWTGREVLLTSERGDAADAFREGFPGFNEANLRVVGIGDMHGEPFVFVDARHPLISMIRENQHLLQSNVDDAERVDGRYLKVDRNVYDICMTQLENQLKLEVPNVDCTQFNISLHRLNGVPWDHRDSVLCESAVSDDVEAALATRHHAKFLMEIEFSHL